MYLANRLWNDEAGFIISAELMIVATVLVLGMLVGLVSVRDQVVQELADVAEAISDFDQTYTFAGVSGHTSTTAGSDFIDIVDFCDVADGQGVGNLSACVDVNAALNPAAGE
ncbi:MAG: hypothetical protein RIC55_26030 [Pirellulaceae bacterium]